MNNTFIQHLSILSPPLHPFNHISYHFNFIVHKMLYKIVAYTSILKIWGNIVLGLTEGFTKLSAFHAVIFVWCYTLFFFVLCMMPVSLDCTFLIAPLVFSNTYSWQILPNMIYINLRIFRILLSSYSIGQINAKSQAYIYSFIKTVWRYQRGNQNP